MIDEKSERKPELGYAWAAIQCCFEGRRKVPDGINPQDQEAAGPKFVDSTQWQVEAPAVLFVEPFCHG
jgi:hypothetical protein